MYKIFSYFLILFFCTFFKPTQATTFIERENDSNLRPTIRPVTQQEKLDTYEILDYALSSPVTDLSLQLQTQPQSLEMIPNISEKLITADSNESPKELILRIIKETDWPGLVVLSQTSHAVATTVFQQRTDIYKINIPSDKNLMKDHLKLMLRASCYTTYAFLTYLNLASYMAFMPIEKSALHVHIAARVLPTSYLDKMKVYCERGRNKEYAFYSFWRAYTDATQMRLLLLSYIHCVNKKLSRYYIETAIRLVRHTQIIGVKLGHPLETIESYIVDTDINTTNIISLATQIRDYFTTEEIQAAYGLDVSIATKLVPIPIPGMEVIFNIRRKCEPIVLTVLPYKFENG